MQPRGIGSTLLKSVIPDMLVQECFEWFRRTLVIPVFIEHCVGILRKSLMKVLTILAQEMSSPMVKKMINIVQAAIRAVPTSYGAVGRCFQAVWSFLSTQNTRTIQPTSELFTRIHYRLGHYWGGWTMERAFWIPPCNVCHSWGTSKTDPGLELYTKNCSRKSTLSAENSWQLLFT